MPGIPDDRKHEIVVGKPLPGERLRLPQSLNGADDAQPVLTNAKGIPDGLGGNPFFYSVNARPRV